MTWTYRISKEARKQLLRLPKDRQQQITESIEEMKENPLRGDVLPLKGGKFKGVLRKRVGRYRIIFTLDTQNHIIEIGAILLRSEKTYR